jgi:glycosyltransferase involved in cell wall biosynthesis
MVSYLPLPIREQSNQKIVHTMDTISTMVKVSVILPTYNRAGTLSRSIKSVLNQTYRNFEIIVVDDASSDNTYSVVNSFDDDRIRYVRHEKNRGANAARNTGIKKSLGEYIAFQDSDDVWMPHKLENQLDVFLRPSIDAGVVYTGVCRIWPNYHTDYLPAEKGESGNIIDALLKGNFIPTQVTMIKKDIFDSHGYFDQQLPRLQDWEMWIRIAEEYHFEFIDEPLVMKHMDVDELSYSNQERALLDAKQMIIKKHKEKFKRKPVNLSRHLLNIGSQYILQGSINEGRNCLKKSIANHIHVKNVGALLLSYFPQHIFKIVHDIYSTDTN